MVNALFGSLCLCLTLFLLLYEVWKSRNPGKRSSEDSKSRWLWFAKLILYDYLGEIWEKMTSKFGFPRMIANIQYGSISLINFQSSAWKLIKRYWRLIGSLKAPEISQIANAPMANINLESFQSLGCNISFFFVTSSVNSWSKEPSLALLLFFMPHSSNPKTVWMICLYFMDAMLRNSTVEARSYPAPKVCSKSWCTLRTPSGPFFQVEHRWGAVDSQGGCRGIGAACSEKSHVAQCSRQIFLGWGQVWLG